MHTFQDQSGTEWVIELPVGIMEEVKAKLDIDLMEPISEDEQLIAKLLPVGASEIKLFVSLVTLLCEEQYKESELTKPFSRVLTAPVLQKAYKAFFDEWHDFFLSLNRMDMVEGMKKMEETLVTVMKQTGESIQAVQIPIENGRISSEELSALVQKLSRSGN